MKDEIPRVMQDDIDLRDLLSRVRSWARDCLECHETIIHVHNYSHISPELAALCAEAFHAGIWPAGECQVSMTGKTQRLSVYINGLDIGGLDADDERWERGSSDEGAKRAELRLSFSFMSGDPANNARLSTLPPTCTMLSDLRAGYFEEHKGTIAVLALLFQERSSTGQGRAVDVQSLDAIAKYFDFQWRALLKHTSHLSHYIRKAGEIGERMLNQIDANREQSVPKRRSRRMSARKVLGEIFSYKSRYVHSRSSEPDDARLPEDLRQLRATIFAARGVMEGGPDLLDLLVRCAITKRIAFYVESLWAFGGLEQWVCDIAHAFKREGYEPYLIVYDKLSHSSGWGGAFPGAVVHLDREGASLANVIERHKIEALVVNHVYEGLVALKAGPAVIEVLHNIYFWQRRSGAIQQARQRVDRFVAVSTAVRDYALEGLGLPIGSIEVIPHALNSTGLYRPRRSYLERRSTHREFRILSVGNVFPQKNLVCLVHAFSRLREVLPMAKLRIAGSIADSEFYCHVRQTAAALRLGEAVTFLGSLDRTYLSREYAQANLFVLASLFEGYGLASLEARYFGLPLILSNTGAAESILSQGSGRVAEIALPFSRLDAATVSAESYYPPESSISELAEKIVSLCDNYDDYLFRALENASDPPSPKVDEVAGMYLDMLRRQGANMQAHSC